MMKEYQYERENENKEECFPFGAIVNIVSQLSSLKKCCVCLMHCVLIMVQDLPDDDQPFFQKKSNNIGKRVVFFAASL